MASVPLAIILIGGYFWLSGGRYVSTDDAYVQQDRITVTPQVSGKIVEAPVRENQSVAAGDVLFVVDPEPYRIALAAADAALASARLQVEQLRAALKQANAAVTTADDDVSFTRKIFDRTKGLLDKGVASQAAYDTAENNLHSAEQGLTQAREKAGAALAALGGNADIATDDHPAVRAALAARDQAALNLANTTVKAPSAGLVAQADRLVVGQPVSTATSVLSLVVSDPAWIEANFKETDLTTMRPGQKATVEIDAYPGRKIEGTIDSIGAGTGAEFSLLPAQNATGNWVKVVQRVPVRIHLDAAPSGLAFRTGLSASVTVDTESGNGTAAAATAN
jgi:membrane fusion protein (multidrug efflux system)